MFALLLSVALSASPKAVPAKPTQLVLDVKPATVVIYLDNKKVGKATKVWTLTVKPGDHHIKLVSKISSQEEVLSVKQGEKTVGKFDLTDSGDKSQQPSNPADSPSTSDSPSTAG